jgi:hypothetical protein
MLDLHDQALGLRRLFRPEGVSALALASGAPGQGVSALAENLAAALRSFGLGILLARGTELLAPPADAPPPDLVIIDGADLSVWAEVADEAALVVAPGRAAAFGALQLMQAHPGRRFRLLFNRMDAAFASPLFDAMQRLAPRPPAYLASLPEDPDFGAAWDQGRLLVEQAPESGFSLKLKALAADIARWPCAQRMRSGDMGNALAEPAPSPGKNPGGNPGKARIADNGENFPSDHRP